VILRARAGQDKQVGFLMRRNIGLQEVANYVVDNDNGCLKELLFFQTNFAASSACREEQPRQRRHLSPA
jgi:hypothetical protein